MDRNFYTDGNFFIVFNIHSTSADPHPRLEQTGNLSIEVGFSDREVFEK